MRRKAPKTESELIQNAFTLTGKSLQQIALELEQRVPAEQKKAKGWVGELIEFYLGATASSLPEPDFQNLGIELKTIPINERGNPRESTYVCMVPLDSNIDSSWQTSVLRLKLKRVLWVPVEASTKIELGQRRIGRPFLWSPTTEQETVLRNDWQELMDLVKMGEISKLNSGLGTHLQVRPKAANASVLTATTTESGEYSQTLPRGFYLRPRFTSSLLASHAN